VPLVQINDALIGNVNFQGLWNASTNTPTLANPPASGTKGYYYIVSTAGTFAGISFEVGDWIISDGTAWGKVDNTDAVSSVFGRTGNVTAANGDYTTAQVTESGNLYYTDGRARGALSFVAGSGAYNSSTGVITIPTNNNQITNGAGYITSAALSGYLPLTGGTMTGNVNWGQTDRGITWGFNTDGASIKFYNTADGDTNSRLEFATLDNNNEYFRWVHIPDGGSAYESMRLMPISSGNAELIVTGKIIKSGGTSSQYLMADGSVSTLSNPVTGTGVNGRVAFWNGTNTITSDADLFWDSTNKRLGISNPSPGSKLGILVPNQGSNFSALDITNGFNASFNVSLRVDVTEITAGGTGNMVFSNTSERMRITSGGNLEMSANSDITFGGSGKGIYLSRAGLGPRASLTTRGGTTWVDIANSSDWSGVTLAASGGNVLVGTTTDAGFKLDVNGTGRFSNQITMAYTGTPRLIVQDTGSGDGNVGVLFKENTSNKWTIASVSSAFQIYNEQTASNALFITSNNNVGIGTNPSYKLDVLYNTSAGNRRFLVTQEGVKLIRSGDSGGWAFGYGFLRNDGVDLGVGFGGAGNGSGLVYYFIGNSFDNPNAVFLPNGNTLIGTTTDNGVKFQVNGDIYAEKQSGNASLLFKRIVNDTKFEISVQESRTRIRTWQTANDRDLYFDSDQAGTTRMIIAGGGAITINNLSGSGNRIVVANSGGTLISAVIGSGLAFDGTTLTATGGSSGSISGSGNSGTIALFTGTTSIGNSIITQSGSNIGINVSNPLANLQVGNGTQSAINGAGNKIHIATNGTRSALLTLANSSGGTTVEGQFESSAESADLRIIVGSSTNHPLVFRTNNTDRLRITSNGTIGINGSSDIGDAGIAKMSMGYLNSNYGWIQTWSSTRLLINPFGNNVLIGTTSDNGNRLRVNGTIFSDSSVTATSFFESSDATIKTLIEDAYQAKGIDSVVAKLYIKNGKQELGYYAQDLEGVLPSAVSKGSNGLLNLSYREVHTAKIAYLEQRIKQLENELLKPS
jgi:hypothetical protein